LLEFLQLTFDATLKTPTLCGARVKSPVFWCLWGAPKKNHFFPFSLPWFQVVRAGLAIPRAIHGLFFINILGLTRWWIAIPFGAITPKSFRDFDETPASHCCTAQ